MTSTPDFPAGELPEWGAFDPTRRDDLILDLDQAPKRLAAVIDSVPKDQLDRKYRNWTIRQIVHHIADSHVHS